MCRRNSEIWQEYSSLTSSIRSEVWLLIIMYRIIESKGLLLLLLLLLYILQHTYKSENQVFIALETIN